jgi:hypothetical protein
MLAILVAILYVILLITMKYRTHKAQKHQNDAQLTKIKKEIDVGVCLNKTNKITITDSR